MPKQSQKTPKRITERERTLYEADLLNYEEGNYGDIASDEFELADEHDETFHTVEGKQTADRIFQIRNEQKLSVTDFANALGVSVALISKVENGDIQPSGALVNSVCFIFGVNKVWLTEGKGEQYPSQSERDADRFATSNKLNPSERQVLEALLKMDEPQRSSLFEIIQFHMDMTNSIYKTAFQLYGKTTKGYKRYLETIGKKWYT